MADKPRVGLVLTPQARAMLRSDPLGELIRNDRVLDCDWVRLDDGYFVHARVAARDRNEPNEPYGPGDDRAD